MKRRTVMSMLAAGTAVSVPMAALWARAPERAVRDVLDAPLPPLETPENPGRAVFDRLSEIICLQRPLDMTTGDRIFDLIQTEPWGPQHVGAVYGKLLTHRTASGVVRPLAELIAEGHLGEGETWFTNHVLTTWYLGIYYHESRPEPVRVSFDSSLMWHALEGQVYPPGFSLGAAGDWSRPPGADSGQVD